MKKILITSTDLMMVQFLLPHVMNLSEHGYEVDLACSNVGGRLNEIRTKVLDYVHVIHEVSLCRNPLSLTNLRGFMDMKEVMRKKQYDVIWTNEPVMGVVTRLCAKEQRKRGAKVLYMAHGFHFYDGAPYLNWLVYYPIEKRMARFADMIVTVNHEDYQRAQSFNVKKVRYIHGIGINIDRLSDAAQRGDIRKELGIERDSFVVLSIGELNGNKNQSTIIKAIALLDDSKVHYILCGKGDKRKQLEELAAKLRLKDRIHFLGYRKDVVDICAQSDVYVMPSYREGLPVSSLEAMYCGLPLVSSNIRGLVDVNKEGKNGFLYPPHDIQGFASGIKRLKNNPQLCKAIGEQNQIDVQPYIINNTKKEVIEIIRELL